MRYRWLLNCWPGLARVWNRGEVSGLTLALLFCVLLNLAIATSLVWTELVSSGTRGLIWLAVAVMWGASLVRILTNRFDRNEDVDSKDLFSIANGEYLRGQFERAAAVLERLIAANPLDVEARLLMAALGRHRRRFEESKEQLRVLQRIEAATTWEWEINNEWQRIRDWEQCELRREVQQVVSQQDPRTELAGDREISHHDN